MPPKAEPKEPTRLSPRALLAYQAGFYAGIVGFATACVGLFLLTGEGTGRERGTGC